MTEEGKKAFDDAAAKSAATRKEELDALRLEAGIDGADCDKSCQAVYADELLKWEKAVFTACEANEKSIECRESLKLKKATEAARKADGYYTKDAQARDAQDSA